jgi:hypothetical protein
MMTEKIIDPKAEFSETLKILATKLTKTEYERVTGTMFVCIVVYLMDLICLMFHSYQLLCKLGTIQEKIESNN